MTAAAWEAGVLLPHLPTRAVARPESAGQVIREALRDKRVRDRYAAKVATAGDHECWFWTGALHSVKGHARFWAGAYLDAQGQRRDVGIIGHRFGWAMVHGWDALLDTPVLAHECDEASCANPSHLAAATQESNRADFNHRRWLPGSPLRDTRGPGGRARAIRHALLTGCDVAEAQAAGLRSVDEDQLLLF